VISRPGYQSAHYTMEVKENQATYLRGVTLIKESTTEVLPTAQDARLMLAVPASSGNFYILVHTATTTGFDVSLYDTTTQLRTIIDREQPKMPDILWSFQGDDVVIIYEEKTQHTLSVFSAKNPTVVSRHTFPTRPGEFPYPLLWQRVGSVNRLFGGFADMIFELQGQDPIPYSTVSSSAWFVSGSGDVWEAHPKQISLRNRTHPAETIRSGTGIKRIIHINDTRAIIEKDTGLVIIDRQGDWSRQINVRDGFETNYSPDRDEWFIILPSEMWIIDADGRTWPINRFGARVQDVARMPEYSIVVYATRDTLGSFHEAYYISNNLYAGHDIDNIAINDALGAIYFTDLIEGTLQLLRRRLATKG